MNRSNEGETRPVTRRRDERFLLLAGGLGLAAATFLACGDDTSGGTTETDAGNDTSTTGSSSGSDGQAAPGCTSSTATAENAAAVATAASALLAALTTDQQTKIQYAASLDTSEQWSNLPTTFIPRNGVMLGDMSEAAQTAAVALVTAATSSQGLTLFSELRAADEWLVTDGKAAASDYGEGRYYVAFVGTPSATSTWQLQIAGHHLAYNFTYNGACTSATPLFQGVEPTSWTDGTTTHAPLEAMRAASVAVIAAVSSDSASLLSGTFTDVVNGPSNQNSKGDSKYPSGIVYPTGTTGRGVNVGSLSADKQALVKTAMETWVKDVADPVSSVLLADYESDASLAETYVAYSGQADLSTQNSYFRIDGPRVWIEYTIQGGIVYHDRVHFHSLWRDKASDYGAEYVDSDAGTSASTDGGMGMGMGMGGPGGEGGPPDGGPGGGGGGGGGP